MHQDTIQYNQAQSPTDRLICELLASQIDAALPDAENKVWHAHPVWFLDGNPVVGYSKLKESVRLLFWSGQSFDEPGLRAEGTFKAAEARYTTAGDVDAVGRLLAEARDEMRRAVDLRPDHEDYRGRLAEFTDGAADPGSWALRLSSPDTPEDNNREHPT